MEEKKGMNLGVKIAIIVVCIAVLAALVFLGYKLISKNTKDKGNNGDVIQEYVEAFNDLDASKIIDCIDFAGFDAFAEIASKFYSYDDFVNNFSDDDYKEFLDLCKKVDKEDAKEEKEESLEQLKDLIAEIKDEYDTYKVKFEGYENKKDLADDIYAADVKISLTTDDGESTDTYQFIVYNNKLLYSTFKGF